MHDRKFTLTLEQNDADGVNIDPAGTIVEHQLN